MPTAAQTATPLSFRPFLLLWSAQSFSVLGTTLSFFAINIYIASHLYPQPDQQSALATLYGTYLTVYALTGIFSAPLTGMLADRASRQAIMLGANLTNAALSMTLLLLIACGTASPQWILLYAAGWGLCNSLHTSAFEASYALMVPADQLGRANSLMQTSASASGLLGPGLAALMLTLPQLLHFSNAPSSGLNLIFAVDAATYLLVVIALTLLTIPQPDSHATPTGTLSRDLRTGWNYTTRQRPLVWLMLTFALLNLLRGPLTALLPIIARDHSSDLHLSFTAGLATLTTAQILGTTLGGVAMTAWGGLKHRQIRGVIVPLLLGSLLDVGFGLSAHLTTGTLLLLLSNFMMPFSGAHSAVIWQTQVPRELQGRVLGLRRVLAQGTVPVGLMLGGLLGGRVDPMHAVTVCASLAFLGVLTILAFTSLRHAGEPPPQPATH